MSLTRRNDGCPQCRNRRLRCDKTEPECLKCLKKGIRCSGQGFECRFSSHMAKVPASFVPLSASRAPAAVAGPASPRITTTPRRPRRARSTTPGSLPQPVSPGSHERRASEPRTPISEDGLRLIGLNDTPITEAASSPACSQPSPSCDTIEDDSDDSSALILSRAIEPLSPERRHLFQHFSEFIAAKMVVFDFGANGYRDIILPLACQDETVGRAVCAVAAFHLDASGVGGTQTLATAEATQHAVLAKLSRDSRELTPSRIFTMSTWVAIVVLLVGETITASSNYVQLLGMLRFLANSAQSDPTIPREAKAFLSQQTRMFELFSSTFTSEPTNLELLSGPIEPYLDWASVPSSSPSSDPDDSRSANLQLIRSAVLASAHLCAQRMQNPPSYLCPAEQLGLLRETIKDLEPSVEGAHALVWTCFVAAAESVLPEHRRFFSRRLAGLYECTRFGTVLKALELLEPIWEKQGKQKWTELVTRERPILVM